MAWLQAGRNVWLVRWREAGRKGSRSFPDKKSADAFIATLPPTGPEPDVKQRFWLKVDRTDECWAWTGAVTSSGYGNYWVDGRSRQAHRLAYEWTVAPIPAGMVLDHLCHNRACVNPGHLRVATLRLNNENKRGARTDSKTGVRGVWWDKRAGKYRAQVQANGRKHSIGYFPTIEGAEAAVSAARSELFSVPGGSR